MSNKLLYWYEKEGNSRNQHANFRRVLNLDTVPSQAKVSIFVDSYYQLFVNGCFIGFGPVRFDPRFPLYDEYDISKYLTTGKNTICIRANYFGMKTYKSIASNAGFFFEGCINNIDVSVSAGGWKCCPSSEHDIYANKISFALSAADYYHQTDEDWFKSDFDDKKWVSPIPVDMQSVWGDFEKRNIPFMSLNKIEPQEHVDVFPIDITKDTYSFSVPFPMLSGEDNPYDSFIGYGSWIYSPCHQCVQLSSFWGETWINGVELKSGVTDEYKNLTITHSVELNEGWNELFGKVGAYIDCVQVFFAVPKSAGLTFSAEKSLADKYTFKHTLPTLKETFKQFDSENTLPLSLDNDVSLLGGWNYVDRTTVSEAPCRWYSWTEFKQPIEALNFQDLTDKTFSKEQYQNGVTINVDLGKTSLCFVRVKLSGAKNARIDIVGSEKFCLDKRYVYTNPLYNIGFRAICTRDNIDYFSLYPMGMRYCAITIRDVESDFTINDIEFINASYPTKRIGSFSCSDNMLNNIWEICVNTQETNMEDAYVDCVGRERGMYIRDTIIQYYNNLAVFGDHDLMRRCLQLYGQSPDATGKYRAVYPNTGTYTIADFCLNVIEGYYVYYTQTGDLQTVKNDWVAMKKNMAWFNKLADTRDDLLLDSAWDIKSGVKASYGGFHGDLGVKPDEYGDKGIHCEFSATYLIAIQEMAYFAKLLGDTDTEEYYLNRCKILSKSISEYLFDEKNGMFKNTMEADTFKTYHPSIFAIRADAATEQQRKRICDYIEKDFKSVFVNGYNVKDGVYFSPSYSFYILEGLYKAGLTAVAQDFIRSSWGVYLIEGLTTTPEYHTYSGGTSVCHAWSAAPLYFLPKMMSGISFTDAPENNHVIINVKAEKIDWARVTWPHRNGVIEVEWHMEKDQRVFDKISVPDGMTYEIV